jgi:hypothetical protein
MTLSIFFEHTTSFIHIYKKINMVITTHMVHKISLKSQQDFINNTVQNISDSEILESFLKNSDEFTNNQKVISSHS